VRIDRNEQPTLRHEEVRSVSSSKKAQAEILGLTLENLTRIVEWGEFAALRADSYEKYKWEPKDFAALRVVKKIRNYIRFGEQEDEDEGSGSGPGGSGSGELGDGTLLSDSRNREVL
jgi:hypothetical protein